MAIGYFICLGDKTDCGGEVLEGDDSISWDGMIHALEDHQVSCGKDGKIYRILGGILMFTSGGRHIAGSLDSISGCPCRAQLLPSVFTASYVNEDDSALQTPKRNISTSSLSAGDFYRPPPEPISTPPACASGRGACDESFQLIDNRHERIGPLRYALLQGNQCLVLGKLDDCGRSSRHGTPAPIHLSFAIGAPSPAME